MKPQFKKNSQPSSVKQTTPLLPNPFSDASTEIKKSGKFILIYSVPGEGKTTLASMFPSPLFIITNGETGIYYAKEVGVAPTSIPVIELPALYPSDSIPKDKGHPGWDKLIHNIRLYAEGNHSFRTLVIDTLSGLEQLCFQHCASLQFEGDMQSRQQDCWNHYAAGPRKAAECYWQTEFLSACVAAVNNGLNVVLLGHSNVRLQANPTGPDYNIFTPELSKQVHLFTNKVLHHVWYMGRYHTFETEKGTKKRLLTQSERFIGVQSEGWYAAKNWDNLQDPIICGSSAEETYKALASKISIS